MRAPLLRLAIGLPIALLLSIAIVVYLLFQSMRPVRGAPQHAVDRITR